MPLWACATRADEFDRALVARDLAARTGMEPGDGTTDLPPGVTLGAPVPVDTAVAIALWRNAAFQAALADLGLRRAEVLQAGQLPNPVLSLLFPLGPKQLEFTAKVPLDALWTRPGRVAAAEADAERTAALLVQDGLDLIRDVRCAFAEWQRAQEQAELTAAHAALADRLDQLAQARLRAGDLSPQAAAGATTAHLVARAQAAQDQFAIELALRRLRLLLGLARDARAVTFAAATAPPAPLADATDEWTTTALAARPDVRAAEWALEAAGERAGLLRHEFLALSGILDANGSGKRGFEAGPGVELPLPLLHQGGAARARGAAEVERAARGYVAVRDRVALEVQEAALEHARAQAQRDAAIRAEAVLASAAAASARAAAAGDSAPGPALEAELALLAQRSQTLAADTSVRRARAQLERAVGRRLP